MAEFFNVINIALIVYSLLLLLRILSTWFRGASLGTPGQILRQITDPYLQIFYRFKFLRSGVMDFTPLAAILVLVVVTQLTSRLAAEQEITGGFFLGVTLFATWRMAQFLFVVFAVACVAKFITVRFIGRNDTPLARIIDALAEAPVRSVSRYISLGENASDMNYLLVTIVVLLAIIIGGRLLVLDFLVPFLLTV